MRLKLSSRLARPAHLAQLARLARLAQNMPRIGLLLLAVLFAAGAGGAGASLWRAAAPPAAAPAAGQPAPAQEPPPRQYADPHGGPSTGAAAAPGTGPRAPEPPDGKWLKDENGQQYFIEKLEKVEGRYMRLDKKTVRTRWGIPIQVVREDDHFFYYKVFKVDPSLVSVGPPKGPTEADLARVAATYKIATPETPESSRLGFVHFDHGLPRTGQWRDGFDVADMNEDGHLDIVHGTPRKGLIPPVIYLGDGKGNWRRWKEVNFPQFPYDYGDAKVADLNGDGHPDLVLGIHLKGIAALLGDGKGNFTLWNRGLDFQEPGKGSGDVGFSSRALEVVHWNGDKRPDILALGEGPRMNISGGRPQGEALGNKQSYGPVVYLNQGDGTWKRKDQGTAGGQIFGEAITVGDFNGDGRPDFATASSIMGAKNLVNIARPDGGWDNVEIDVRPGAYVNSVHAADFDHDGRSDLAVGYLAYELGVWRTGIDIFYSRPGGKWERRALAVKEGREGVTALGSGHLNGDGALDLVALTGDGETWVFLGDGKGFFTREPADVIPRFEGGCRGYHLKLVDVDGDGRDEIVASFAGEASPMFAPDACRTGGAIQVWHAQPWKAGQGQGDKDAKPGKTGS